MSNEQDLKMQKIAQKILYQTVENYSKHAKKDNENFGFVITILMIISIVLTLIRVIQECNKNKIRAFAQEEKYSYFNDEIKTLSLKRTWFTKMMIKKTIRKTLNREQYKEYGIDLMNAILDNAEKLNNDEIVTLVEAANV